MNKGILYVSIYIIVGGCNVLDQQYYITLFLETILGKVLIFCSIIIIIYLITYIKRYIDGIDKEKQMELIKNNLDTNIKDKIKTPIIDIINTTEYILSNKSIDQSIKKDIIIIKDNAIISLNRINQYLYLKNTTNIDNICGDIYIYKHESGDNLDIKYNGESGNKLYETLKFISKSDNSFINQVIDIIKDNYTDSNFTTYCIINEIGISRSTLFKKVKDIIGITPMELIKDIRLQAAINLLKEDISISEIAFKSGFNDSNYFSKCFKNVYGKTPTEYKNEELFKTK